MTKKILYSFLSFFFVAAHVSAQLFNGNSIIYNDGSVIVTESLTNNGSTIVGNSGLVRVTNNVVNNNALSAFNDSQIEVANNINNTDTIALSQGAFLRIDGNYLGSTSSLLFNNNNSAVALQGNFDNANGQLAQDSSCLFLLNGVDQTINFSVGEDYIGTFEITGGGDKLVNNFVLVRDINLVDGIVKTDLSGDTLVLLSESLETSGSATSHIQGPLFILTPLSYSGEIRFPLGYNDGTSNVFAPIETEGFAPGTDSSLFRGRAIAGSVTSLIKPDVVQTIYNGNYWELLDYETGGHSPYKMKLYADEALVGTNPNSWLVTQSNSNSVGSNFNSLGRSNFLSAGDTSSVVSNRNYSRNYLAIGTRCVTAKLAIDLAMEGVSGTSTTYKAFLDSLYIDGETVNGVTITELVSSLNPQTIDLVSIILRDGTNPTTIVDSTRGWLINSGSVVDYETGTTNFVEFCPSAGGVTLGEDYYVEVEHKNHLPVITSNTDLWTAVATNPSPLTVVDFTDATIHHSIGGYKANANAEMLAGNAINSGSSFNKITPLDLQYVLFRMSQLPATGYSIEDLNLDGTVDVVDYNLVRDNSVFARRAVLPY